MNEISLSVAPDERDVRTQESHQRVRTAPRGARRVMAVVAIADVAAVAIAFVALALICDLAAFFVGPLEFGAAVLFADWREFGVGAAFLVALYAFGGLYSRAVWEIDETRRIFFGALLVGCLNAITLAKADALGAPAAWVVLAWLAAGALILCGRMVVGSLKWVRDAGSVDVVLVGGRIKPTSFIKQFSGKRYGGMRLQQAVDVAALSDKTDDELRREIGAIAYASDVPANRLRFVLAPTEQERAGSARLAEALKRLGHPPTVALFDTAFSHQNVALSRSLGSDLVLVEPRADALRSPERLLKAGFDIFVAALLIILIAPLLLTISGLLALEGGPVFFTQKRIGRRGRRFRCFKFRTMRPDAEERLKEILATDPKARQEWEKHQKLTNDPRITRVGKFLRETSLDELPQLFNVLKGDMSLVGPRPITAPELVGYSADLAYYNSPEFAYYSECMPGITGLWQVSGRAQTAHSERVRLDRWYARHWSFWLDLVILLRTVRAILGRTGS